MKKHKILALVLGLAIALAVSSGCDSGDGDGEREIDRKSKNAAENKETPLDDLFKSANLDLFKGVKIDYHEDETFSWNKTSVNLDEVDDKLKSYTDYTIDGFTVTASILKSYVDDNGYVVPDAVEMRSYDTNTGEQNKYYKVTKNFIDAGIYKYINDVSQIKAEFVEFMQDDFVAGINQYGENLMSGTKIYFDEFGHKSLLSTFLGEDLEGDIALQSYDYKITDLEIIGLDSAYFAADETPENSKFFFLYEVKITGESSKYSLESTEASGILTVAFENILLDENNESVYKQGAEWLSPKKTADEAKTLMDDYESVKIK